MYPLAKCSLMNSLSRLYRAVGSGFNVSRFTSKGSQGDQLLVNVQALNVDCTLSFKGREGNER